VGSFATRLLAWFEEYGRRDLPWQADRSAYSVWVSEIMLQQTQVATVIPYFTRFIARFPTVEMLAAAPLDDVLALWAGLGYYARARNLHRAARVIVEDHEGQFPASLDGLMDLPGVGRSTAGAILALAMAGRAPILDGNVKRVLARYHAVEGWPGHTKIQRQLWEHAEAHTPETAVAEYTQAIMDLGATVCTRTKPLCDACPVSGNCQANRQGLQERFPGRKSRAERRRRDVRLLLVRDPRSRILLEKRPARGIWGGLYSLPELADEDDPGFWCDRHLGAAVETQTTLSSIEHAFTHFDLHIEPLLIGLTAAPRSVMDRDGWLWYNPAHEIEVGVAAPISTLLRSLQEPEENLL